MAWDSERHFFHGDYIYFFCPAVASAQTGLEGFWRYTKSYQTSLWEARIGWMPYITNSDPSFLHSGNKRWLSDSGRSSFYWWNVLCNMKPSILQHEQNPPMDRITWGIVVKGFPWTYPLDRGTGRKRNPLRNGQITHFKAMMKADSEPWWSGIPQGTHR